MAIIHRINDLDSGLTICGRNRGKVEYLPDSELWMMTEQDRICVLCIKAPQKEDLR